MSGSALGNALNGEGPGGGGAAACKVGGGDRVGERASDRAGGSRFLYEPFDRGPVPRSEVLERVLEERWAALEYRLGQIETMLERLDRRLWLTVFGVVSAIMVEAMQGLLAH